MKLTCEGHKAIKLNYKNTRSHVLVVLCWKITENLLQLLYIITSCIYILIFVSSNKY